MEKGKVRKRRTKNGEEEEEELGEGDNRGEKAIRERRKAYWDSEGRREGKKKSVWGEERGGKGLPNKTEKLMSGYMLR